MTTPAPVFETFSLTHAQVLDGSTAFITAALAASAPIDQDVYGVSDGSITPNVDNWNNEGDDATLSRWYWMNYAEVAVEAGYFSMPLIKKITAVGFTSSGTGSGTVYSQDLWHESSQNVAPFPLILRMLAKDNAGIVRGATIGLYRFQPAPMTFAGPSYKDGVKVSFNGTALMSPVDELGAVFADGKKRVGKILSHA